METISLLHGSGTGLAELLDTIIKPGLEEVLCPGPFEDAAVLVQEKGRIAFTTDSFVVKPLEFPGGDIGKLAVCGTVNDLAMMGAVPKYLALALIIEEALPVEAFKRILRSIMITCKECGVVVSCGDTKIVDKGKGDGIFITTTGIGELPADISLSVKNAREGDAVIVSGAVGFHGITILSQRMATGLQTKIRSDCAPLHELAARLLKSVPQTRLLRDATRGGCSAVLNEIANESGVTIHIDRSNVPVDDAVRGACSYLGVDPLDVANEGRFIAIVPSECICDALKALHTHPSGTDAACIGVVEARKRFAVTITTEIGAVRPLEIPHGRLLPRIC